MPQIIIDISQYLQLILIFYMNLNKKRHISRHIQLKHIKMEVNHFQLSGMLQAQMI